MHGPLAAGVPQLLGLEAGRRDLDGAGQQVREQGVLLADHQDVDRVQLGSAQKVAVVGLEADVLVGLKAVA